MECFIPGQNVKVLAKSLQALAKVGDEVNLEVTSEKLSFITLNSTKTVCAGVTFLKTFFTSFQLDEFAVKDRSKKALTCRIQLKILLPLFRGNLEKKLDFFKLEHEPDSDFLTIKMKYKFDDLLMSHKLRLMDESTHIVNNLNVSNTNNLEAPSEFYNQLLAMFNTNDDEIVFEITSSKIVARNYCVGAPSRPKMMRTQSNINPSDFRQFSITKDTSINFPLKPFRTVISFAENFNLDIVLKFDIGGKPLTILLLNSSFEVNFTIATINPYTDTNTSFATMGSTSILGKIDDLNNDFDDFVAAFDSEQLNVENELASVSPPQSPQSKKRKKSQNEDVRDEDEISRAESPRTTKLRMVFGRCFRKNADLPQTDNVRILAPNSDSE